MAETREQIKNRMLKTAGTIWGVPANEIEMSFDPVISLLLSACAVEIEHLSDKISESQTRVTEKIIQLMTPEAVFGPRPAHCVIKTEPSEDGIVLKPEVLFSLKKKASVKENVKDVFFSPVQDFKIVQADVKYLAFANTVLELEEVKNKVGLIKTNDDFIEDSTLYIGITTKGSNLDFSDTSFYFELQDMTATDLFFHHLKLAKWYSGDKLIQTNVGFYNDNIDNEEMLSSMLREESLKSANIVTEIRNNYKRHYITLKENIKVKPELPEEFKNIDEKNRAKIDENTVWLKVVFSNIINKSILENIYCSLNSFPAVNRKAEEFSYQLKEFVNIVPIRTQNLFLDIKSITSINGKKYNLLSRNISNASNKKGTYVLKTDNIAKVDNRKAKDYISHLIELLRSESASFSYLNNSFLQNNLRKLNQIISILENKLIEAKTHQYTEINYVSVTPYEKKDTLMVEYWSTDGSFANNIKYGTELNNYKTIGLEQKSSFLLTSSHSGRDALNMDERLLAYRRSLLSRDRIVTKEDLKSVCFEFFGDKIENVDIKNSYTIDLSLNKGMINCIDIELTVNKSKQIDEVEWDFVKNNLLLFLEKHATSVFPFVIKKV